MATRALITFNEPASEISITIYVHSDGAPDTLGVNLAKALSARELINYTQQGNYANGAGDLFLQVISELKDNRNGYIYLTNPELHGNEINYHYEVTLDDNDLIFCSIAEHTPPIPLSQFTELVKNETIS